ncbi:MAG TPA: ATP-binding protein [Steroidobacteraceae bacterium]|nr:ATP-binding protein [Steroidobacteraceae bacterium]
MRILKLGKYKGLVAVLALFLVGSAAMLVTNYQFAVRAAESLTAIRGISAQQLQPQVIAASAQLLRADLGNRRYLGRALTDLKSTVRSFDEALAGLDRSATASAGRAGPFEFAPLASAPSQRSLQELRQVWGDYRERLKPIIDFTGNPYVETADRGTQLSAPGLKLNSQLDEAVRFGVARHGEIAKLVASLSANVESETQTRASQLRMYLVAGMAGAVLLFVVAFGLLGKAAARERSIVKAKKETDDILHTVNQGLFLLDKNLDIGSERSEALERIFHRTDFDKMSFERLLRGIVPDKTLETALEYVKLMWGERVNEKLIKTINPLGEVEVSIDAGNGQMETQFLEFDFNRVHSDGRMSRLLVTVIDVTRRVELARELQESQEKAQAQLDLLLHILHVEPRQLTGFLEESEVAMKMVNSILKEPAREESAFRAKLDGIFRQIHSVKGEAAALGLKTVESRAHGFEEALQELRNRHILSGNDFLPLVVKLDDLFGHLAQVREMVSRLADLRVAMAGDSEGAMPADRDNNDFGPEGTLVQAAPNLASRGAASVSDGLESSLKSLAQRIASEQGKKVKVACVGLEQVPNDYRRAIKDISIQMVRNCVAHGIEAPAERASAGKSPAGSITLKFEGKGAEGFEFVCQDDGRGLDAEKLKQTAVKRGLMTAEQAASLDDRRALSLIFMAGFSTQEQVTRDAGRGVGMDIVRNLIQELGGKVGVSTTVGRFSRFRIWLPAAAKASRAA